MLHCLITAKTMRGRGRAGGGRSTRRQFRENPPDRSPSQLDSPTGQAKAARFSLVVVVKHIQITPAHAALGSSTEKPMRHAHGRSRAQLVTRRQTHNGRRRVRSPSGGPRALGRTPPRALALSTARHTTPPGLAIGRRPGASASSARGRSGASATAPVR